MAGVARNEPPKQEEIPLPDIVRPKEHDFAPRSDDNSPSPETHSASKNRAEVRLNDEDDHGLTADSASDTTATNSSDEFDWDEQDEEEKEKAAEKTKARRGRAIWLAFMKLSRFVRVLLIGALGAGVLIAPLLVVELRFKSSVARPHAHMWSLWLSIVWAASCATYLIVDYVPKLFMGLIVLFGGSVERLRTQIELTLAVAAWLKLALDITWAWIALSVLRATYHPPGGYWVIINRVMQALFAAGLILLAEKIFLRFVAINFHQKALADRLSENRLGLKALDRLSNAQPAVYRRSNYRQKGHKSPGSVPTSQPPTRRNSLDLLGLHTKFGKHPSPGDAAPSSASGSPIHEKGHSSHDGHADKAKGHHSHVEKKVKSADAKMRRKKAIASVVVDQVSGAIGQVALKNSKLNRDVGGLYSARKLARKLFSALSYADPPRDYLLVEDFYPYFPNTAEAHAAFAVFDKDGNGDITKKEMREAVQRIYRERKALVASLKDVGSIVAKLDAVLICIALLVIFFICLLIFNRKDTLSSLVPLATIILGFSFIFGHSAQLLFESLIFIFSTHVFDVGDLVMIDDQPLFVREFGLFSTTFRRVDGQEIIAPNALLASAKLVHNMRRSNSMWETTNLMISYNTPLELIEQLRQRINNYVSQHNREWSGCGVHIDKMEFQNAIHLIIAMEHRPNWQDWGGRWARRTEFMRYLKTALEELDLRYTMPVQPVLLPRGPPFGANGTPNLNLPPRSPPGRMGSRDTLGNAGSFQGSDFMLRAPSRSINSDTNVFRRVEGL
ncbi:hypothetical protein GLOTRDRAFT_111417 [Gloeophyllum trabeum ATCC 11539]|uniref:EF-hand domain-containing protein n=1 Tax=Gloeophyllum trabeum (strain ATCC 11539 / FP-39264 / Madison 617) TaxID=670483 RepID=S7Q5Q2_GLOTA|nr:uncharacterized protein GLOTRDRAFT_111417 [Gloeophyllum trabeum ATCC 11539]EPQ54807.1 hypothetical protein GLOTRDRAFT_111417 [Gloeophyllum trabeum ATCC 11539]